MNEVKKLLVVGTGTMGAGIAQVAAQAGCTVWMHDQQPGAAAAAKKRIADTLARAADRGHVKQEDVQPTLDRLQPVASLDEVTSPDAVIEAVLEELGIKQTLFASLQKRFGEKTPLWTNTSMIPITQIAQGLVHPQQLVGTHFFNPVPRMKLVEVIAGEKSAPQVVELAQATMKRWGKTPVLAPDTPGFIVNRVFDAIKRVALQLLEEGTPADQIDAAVKMGLNFPMGPFEVMDLVGLDTTYRCLQTQAAAMSQSTDFGTHLPRLVAEKNLGRKTGQGFYKHSL